jgi:UDP-glucose 4-epimerase
VSVLITGGAGYIGSHMALALADRGARAVILDDLSTGVRDAIPTAHIFVQGDIADADLVTQLIKDHGIVTVAHFAAKTVVPDSVADPLGYYFANTVKTHALIRAAIGAGVQQVLFSSTAALYGEPDRALIDEEAPLRPANPYGASKLMSERMLADAARAHGVRTAVLRYFNVAGADPAGRAGQSTPNATHLIKVAVQAALGRRPRMEVYGDDYPTPDGSCVRDFIHVSDLIDAHMLALDHLQSGGESLLCNCGYGRGYSVLEVIEAVRRISGVDFEVRRMPRRPGDSANVVADPTRIKQRLGWTPRYNDLDTIIRHALAWERRA